MPEHPCADGLTSACFAAYPTWARQALAYKLLHLLLPKQLTAKLPKMLRYAFPNLPPGWPEGVPLPHYLDLEHFPVSEPPESGAAPPIFTPPWEPGPTRGPGGIITTPGHLGTLLYSESDPTEYMTWGHIVDYDKYAGLIYTFLTAKIRAIKIKVGTQGSPTDSVYAEIWTTLPDGTPNALITNGSSTPISAALLPTFSLDQAYITFLFPNEPIMDPDTVYHLVLARTGNRNYTNHYRVGVAGIPTFPVDRHHYMGFWETFGGGLFNLKIYGVSL